MKAVTGACLGAAILLEVVATSSLKAVDGFKHPIALFVVMFGYGGAFYLLSLTLKEIPVGVAYAVWSAAGTVLVTLVGWLWYKQSLSLTAIFGLGLIVVGVVLVNLSGPARS